MSRDIDLLDSEVRADRTQKARMSFGARSIALRRDWSHQVTNSNSRPEQRIRGHVVLVSPVPVTGAPERNEVDYLRMAQLEIRPGLSNEEEGRESAIDDILCGVATGAVLSIEYDWNTQIPASLRLSLSESQFAAIWDGVTEGIAIDIYGRLELDLHDSIKAGKPTSARINATSLTVSSNVGQTAAKGSDIAKAFCSDHLADDNGQITQIACELGHTVAAAARHSDNFEKDGEHIRRIIQELRRTFLQSIDDPSEPYKNSWSLSAKDFAEMVRQRSADEAQHLKDRFSRVWKHYSVQQVILRGEEHTSPEKDGYQVNVAALEEVAEILLSKPTIYSATLEWALLNALIYGECIGFARHVLKSERIVFGLSLPSPLKGISESNSIGRALWSSTKSIGIEALKLLGTFAIASVLADGNAATAWTIMTGITAARWVSRAVLHKEDSDSRQRKLLARMIAVHEHLNSYSFNAQRLRAELYAVCDDGAIFNRYVFNILDARIARDRMGSGNP